MSEENGNKIDISDFIMGSMSIDDIAFHGKQNNPTDIEAMRIYQSAKDWQGRMMHPPRFEITLHASDSELFNLEQLYWDAYVRRNGGRDE